MRRHTGSRLILPSLASKVARRTRNLQVLSVVVALAIAVAVVAGLVVASVAEARRARRVKGQQGRSRQGPKEREHQMTSV